MSLKRPSIDNASDWDLYNKLWDKDPEEHTDEEEEFLKTMYHFEKGLGDRL